MIQGTEGNFMSNIKIISERKYYKYLYQIYSFLIELVRQNKIIHKKMFGFYPHHDVEGGYWDWTTIIIKKAMQKYLRLDMSILDVGTGPVGVLAIYAALNIRCKKVCGIDYCPELVSLAKKNAEKQNLNIQFLESDLFDKVSEKYDLIVFNSPYIDIHTGRTIGLFNNFLAEKRWSGGTGGYKTIERFLADAPSNLSDRGYVILGVNHVYISKASIIQCIQKSSFEKIECLENSLTLASAYVLKLKNFR